MDGNEFQKLYNKYYPYGGPSISSYCWKSEDCGCWRCLGEKLKELEEKNETKD